MNKYEIAIGENTKIIVRNNLKFPVITTAMVCGLTAIYAVLKKSYKLADVAFIACDVLIIMSVVMVFTW